MKTLHFTRLLAVLFVAFSIMACQKDAPPAEDSLAYIPKEVAMVSAINPQQLMDKADFAALKQTEGFQNMVAEAKSSNPVLAKVMMNPEQSGVDLSKNIYMAMEPTEDFGRFGVVTLSLSDADAFAALLEDIEMEVEATPASQQYNMAFPNNNSAMAWNEEVVIIGYADKPTDLRAQLEKYLNSDTKESAAQNKKLRQALNKEYDVLNWFSSDFLLSNDVAKGGATLLNYDEEDLKGNYIEHYLTFDKGEVTSEAYLDFKGQIANDLSMLFRDNVKTDFTQLAPAGDPLFLLSTAFNINGLNQLLVEKYSKGIAEKELKQYDLSSKELLDALHGDIMLAAYPSGQEDKEAALLFMARIEEATAIQKLIDAGVKEEKVEALEDGSYRLVNHEHEMIGDSVVITDEKTYPAYFLMKDGMFYLSSEQQLITKAQSGDTGMSGGIAQKGNELLKQHIFTALGNPNSLEDFKDEINGVESVEASANRKGTKLKLKMENKSENSLKVIIEQMQAAEKEKEASEL